MDEKRKDRRAAALLILFCLVTAGTLLMIYLSSAGVPEKVKRELTAQEKQEITEENSSLTDYICLSPHGDFPRKEKISRITIHNMGGDVPLEYAGKVFRRPDRKQSSNYAIDSKGKTGLYVEEENRSYALDSEENDQKAVTILIADMGEEEDSFITPEAFKALTELCTDICYRNDIERLTFTGDEKGSLTYHYMFNDKTDCPGKYMRDRTDQLIQEVNLRLEKMRGEEDEKK